MVTLSSSLMAFGCSFCLKCVGNCSSPVLGSISFPLGLFGFPLDGAALLDTSDLLLQRDITQHYTNFPLICYLELLDKVRNLHSR